jgi:hypothetical protein
MYSPLSALSFLGRSPRQARPLAPQEPRFNQILSPLHQYPCRPHPCRITMSSNPSKGTTSGCGRKRILTSKVSKCVTSGFSCTLQPEALWQPSLTRQKTEFLCSAARVRHQPSRKQTRTARSACESSSWFRGRTVTAEPHALLAPHDRAHGACHGRVGALEISDHRPDRLSHHGSRI